MAWKATGPAHASRPFSRLRQVSLRAWVGEGATAPSPALRFGWTVRRAGHGSSDNACSRSPRVNRGSGRSFATRMPWASATRLRMTADPAAVGLRP